jgi:hypothetical protein
MRDARMRRVDRAGAIFPCNNSPQQFATFKKIVNR